jgi:hypothetical protein
MRAGEARACCWEWPATDTDPRVRGGGAPTRALVRVRGTAKHSAGAHNPGGSSLRVRSLVCRSRARCPATTVTSPSLRPHLVVTSSSLRPHLVVTSSSLRRHFVLTSSSLRSLRHFGRGHFVTSSSLRRHFTSSSHRPHFDLTSSSLRRHFVVTSSSLSRHFGHNIFNFSLFLTPPLQEGPTWRPGMYANAPKTSHSAHR